MNKILILTSGNVSKLEAFKNEPVDVGSFEDICWNSASNDLRYKIYDLRNYKLIYFRLVGKSLEIATLVAEYAAKNGVKIIDKMYEKSRLLPTSLGKILETKKLCEAGVKMPKTVLGNFDSLPYPYVIKSTTGRKGKEVWLIRSEIEMRDLRELLDKNKIYFAQEFIPNAKRIRALVVGDKVLGAIVRETKWNKDGTKETLASVPEDISKLALDSAKALDLDICGVDILIDESGQKWVIEANAAPAWKLINKYCNVNVEHEIVKYLQEKI